MNHQIVRLSPGLYFVATPIGTARDITLRALDILASADVLAAEDTRSLRRLMDIHAVPLSGRRILSYHDHSGEGARAHLMQALADGRSVAYASEAGMPLIADPGFDLSRAASAAGHTVTTAPGPSAVLTALVLAGLPTDAFFFSGFLPSATVQRQTRVAELRDIPGTLVFYESPKRLAASLKDMATVLGEGRSAAICRELTKKFEEVLRGTLGDLIDSVAGRTLKGEIVVVVDRDRSPVVNEVDLEQELRRALATLSVKDAADMVAKAHNLPRRRLYQMALALDKRTPG